MSTDKDTHTAGDTITIRGGRLPIDTDTDTDTEFVLHSDPVTLGTAIADGDGFYRLVTQLPDNTASGLHDIVATAAVRGTVRTSTVSITVEGKTGTAPPVEDPKDNPVDGPKDNPGVDDEANRTIPLVGSSAPPGLLVLIALLLGTGVGAADLPSPTTKAQGVARPARP